MYFSYGLHFCEQQSHSWYGQRSLRSQHEAPSIEQFEASEASQMLQIRFGVSKSGRSFLSLTAPPWHSSLDFPVRIRLDKRDRRGRKRRRGRWRNCQLFHSEHEESARSQHPVHFLINRCDSTRSEKRRSIGRIRDNRNRFNSRYTIVLKEQKSLFKATGGKYNKLMLRYYRQVRQHRWTCPLRRQGQPRFRSPLLGS